MTYQNLSEKKVYETEKEISNYWKHIDLLKRSMDIRPEEKSFIFYDGPPTANGKPGIHHVISRALKDSVCRFKTMDGFHVKRKLAGIPMVCPLKLKLRRNST